MSDGSEIVSSSAGHWAPLVSTVGDSWHVEASDGSMMGWSSDEWSFDPAGGSGVRHCLRNIGRYLSGIQLRAEYPKSARRLRKSVVQCQRWCDWRNRNDVEIRAMRDELREQLTEVRFRD